MSLDHFVAPEHKEVLKKKKKYTMREVCQRDMGAK